MNLLLVTAAVCAGLILDGASAQRRTPTPAPLPTPAPAPVTPAPAPVTPAPTPAAPTPAPVPPPPPPGPPGIGACPPPDQCPCPPPPPPCLPNGPPCPPAPALCPRAPTCPPCQELTPFPQPLEDDSLQDLKLEVNATDSQKNSLDNPAPVQGSGQPSSPPSCCPHLQPYYCHPKKDVLNNRVFGLDNPRRICKVLPCFDEVIETVSCWCSSCIRSFLGDVGKCKVGTTTRFVRLVCYNFLTSRIDYYWRNIKLGAYCYCS